MQLYQDTMTLPGSLLEGENPQPYFRAREQDLPCYEDGTLTPAEKAGFGAACGSRVLPYRMQDRYSRGESAVTLKTIVLENEFLRAVFLPGFGAKLWSLYSKAEGRELLFKNPVLRPANLANRNAWTSGGIEWNLGHNGHHAFTCADLYCAAVHSPDGETFLRVYEYEATHGQVLQIDFHLPDSAAQLAAHVRIENTLPSEQPLYWWTNVAVPLTPFTRVFSGTAEILYQLTPGPGQPHFGFGRCTMPRQPNLCCEDISYPHSIPHSVEYFFQNSRKEAAPWEVSFEGDGRGFFERSTQPLFARKMFCWGNSTGGRHWCEYLSQPGRGDYIELQAGLSPTQLHTTSIPAGASVCFTQLFGAFCAPQEGRELEWNTALPFVARQVEKTLPAAWVQQQHREYREKAVLPAKTLLHRGGDYGGLEQCRRRRQGEPLMAPHLHFPHPGGAFAPWLELLESKRPAAAARPWPYLTDPRWLPLLKEAAGRFVENAELQFQYAVSLAENGRVAEAAPVLEALAQQHDPFALHALGALAQREGQKEAAGLYLRAYQEEKGLVDASFAEDALNGLIETGQYELAWKLYAGIPEEKRTGPETLLAAAAAVKLGEWAFLEEAFQREYASIREGAAGLAEVWFEYQARRKAQQEGTAFSPQRIDRTLPLPPHLDFRMFGPE